jgi:hypothetical protein
MRHPAQTAVVANAAEYQKSFVGNYPLYWLSPNDPFTTSNAFEGVHIFGGNGSGKTSGSGAALARAFLRSGMGGIVLTAKPDECDLWRRYAQETGRTDHLIVFSPEERWRFNPFTYESRRKQRGGGLTHNIVRMLSTVSQASSKGQHANDSKDQYFRDAANQLMASAIDACLLGDPDTPLSLSRIRQVINSAPRSMEEISLTWQENSLCYLLIDAALANERLRPSDKRDLDVAGDYFLNEFPQLPHDTRGSIISTFTVMADVFMRGVIGELFSAGLNVVPEVAQEGAIMVLDLPVKTFGHAGLLAQVLWKYIWQQSIERRDVNLNPRPCFLWADESHLFVNEHDVSFCTTARSARACTVFLSQTLANYYWALGGEIRGKALTDSLMGVLQTKIFHANSDPATNKWSADVFARSWQSRANSGSSRSDDGKASSNAGYSQSLEHNVREEEFLTLPKGGPSNNFLVGAIIGQGGRIWRATGKTFLKTYFNQREQ